MVQQVTHTPYDENLDTSVRVFHGVDMVLIHKRAKQVHRLLELINDVAGQMERMPEMY